MSSHQPALIFAFNVVLLLSIVISIAWLAPTIGFFCLVAAFIASLLEPVVAWLTRLRVPPHWQSTFCYPWPSVSRRGVGWQWHQGAFPDAQPFSRGMVAFVLVFGLFIVALLLAVQVLPQLRAAMGHRLETLPVVFEQQVRPNIEALLLGVQQALERNTWLQFQGELNLDTLLDSVPDVTENGSRLALSLMQALFGHTLHLIEFLVLLFIIFFMVLEWHRISVALIDLLCLATPGSWHASIRRIWHDVINMSRRMILGMTTVGAILSLMIMILLPLLADYPLSLAIPLGLFCGYLSVIPYVGSAIAVAVGLLATFLLHWFSNPMAYVWTFFILWALNFFLEGKVLTPRLVGSQLDVFKVLIILAVAAGGEMLGLIGFLVALPVLVVCKALLNEWMRLMREYHTHIEPQWQQQRREQREVELALQREAVELMREGLELRRQRGSTLE